METPDEPAPTVTIGGREVSHLVAALIAQESDRLGILPGMVGDVVIPDPVPTHVVISGFRLSIPTSAAIAAFADANGLHPVRVIQDIVREHAEALDRKARTRETTCPLEGTWALPSDSPSRAGAAMTPERRERVARLLSAAELGLKDAADSLREAEALLKNEPEAGMDRDQLRTYAVVADANRAGIERMEARIRQAGEDS